jgi:hypothetical protein
VRKNDKKLEDITEGANSARRKYTREEVIDREVIGIS